MRTFVIMIIRMWHGNIATILLILSNICLNLIHPIPRVSAVRVQK